MCFLECLFISVKFRDILSIIFKVSVEGIINVIYEKGRIYIFLKVWWINFLICISIYIICNVKNR